MPAIVNRLSPVVVVVALVALATLLYRRPSVLLTRRRPRVAFSSSSRGLLRLGFKRSRPVICVTSALVVVLVASLYPRPADPLVYGRAAAASTVSSRGGFRLPEIAVLGATPQPVQVLSRLVGPPSPDPVLLAAARIALTPTPTPQPVAPLLQAGFTGEHRDLGVFKVTGYSDSPYLNGTDGRGITRSGVMTHWGAVAVDPRIIPLGTHLVIENYEGTVFTALDTGGAVKGRWIDIWFPTDYEALEHGLRDLAVAIVEGD